MPYPNNSILFSGFGNDQLLLVSFDKAIFSEQVTNYILVRVSSILSSGCISFTVLSAKLGSILYAHYATRSSSRVGVNFFGNWSGYS